jgi:hypothetical protein
MTPLELVRGRLSNVKAYGKGWRALCPAHDDHHPSLDLAEGQDGRVLLKCRAGCSYEAILRALGLDPKDVNPKREQTSRGKQTSGGKRPITLKELAQDKALAITLLTSLGVHDLPNGGVGIPYYDEMCTQQHVKRRTALKATEGSFWPRGQPLMPYGLEDLAYAREKGYLVVPEGESDRWTLLYHHYPVLAIPGASAVGCLTAEHVRDIPKLYLIQEPDRAGEHFIPAMAQQLRKIGWTGETYVISMNGAKDPNELHKRDPNGFKMAFQAAMDQAEPLSSEEAPDEWPDPIPFDAPVTLPRFPLDALPKPIAAYVQEVAATRQVPIDLSGMLSLGTVSAAAAKRFRVQIGNTHSEPVNLFEAVAMEPGSRKSAVYADMIEPLEVYEQELQADKALEITRAQETRAIEEGRLRSLREQAVKGKTPTERDLARQEALQLASQLTTIPPEPRLVAGDITPEKLANLLFEQGGRIAVMDAEAGGVFEIMAGPYTHDGKANLDIYLRGHAGDTLRVDRLGRTTEYV